jgi:photosystem II stability/assembly factor-like uncharacterized protein
MRRSRLHQILLCGLILTVVLGCNLLSNVSTPLASSGTPAVETPSVQATATFPASPAIPTAEVALGTQTPLLPQPIQGSPIAHLASGQKFGIMYIHMLDANQGWGIGGTDESKDHVFRTQTGGQTWRDVTPPQPAPAAGNTIVALGFFADASNGWVVYGSANSPSVPSYVQVWFTHDGGVSWNNGIINTTGVSDESFSPWYLDFSDSQHGWLLVLLGAGMMHAYVALYSTSDGGATWKDILDPLTENDIQSFTKTGMIFVDAHTGWLTRDAQGVDAIPHIFLTRDGGVNWTRIDLPAPADTTGWFDNNSCGTYSPFAFSTQSVYLVLKCLDNATYKVEHDYLYSTGDGGQTWQSVSLPSAFTVTGPPNGGLFFTNTESGLALGRWIYHTDDAGKTWSAGRQVNWDGQFSFIDLNTGWAVATNAGQTALVSTADGGSTWRMVQPVMAP